mgnify:FL=1
MSTDSSSLSTWEPIKVPDSLQCNLGHHLVAFEPTTLKAQPDGYSKKEVGNAISFTDQSAPKVPISNSSLSKSQAVICKLCGDFNKALQNDTVWHYCKKCHFDVCRQCAARVW